MGIVRARVIVDGRVQGVFFREGTRRVALEHGLAGWVRNLPDGRVEAVFEGPEHAVASAVAWARRGPEHAVVTGIEEVEGEQPEGLAEFEVRN
jgi:acylphosphatase